jgi:type I restriction-modification system DNA methylase subunit
VSKATRDRAPPSTSITKLITGLGYRHQTHQVFSDFVELAAISISNAVDTGQQEKREARYMEIVKRYQTDELQQFPKMLGELVNELETVPRDVLGEVFHELELHNKWTGQFFTPFPLCQMMAKMNVGEGVVTSAIEQRGFLAAMEPACGSGAMVIALALALRDDKINYQQHLHVHATDVDAKCVHMAYLQLSLLHIPAIVIHGNSLSMEEWGRWYTPAHIMGGWDWKLARAHVTETKHAIEPMPEMPADPALLPAPMNARQLSLF